MAAKPALWTDGPFKLFERRLEITGKPNKQQITTQANKLARTGNGSKWALGDLSVYCEVQLGWDSFEEALKQTQANYHTLRHAYYVAKAYDPESARDHDLSFEHYRSVYTFPEDVRRKLLTLAEENEWSIDEFKSHLKTLRRDIKAELQSFPEGRYGLIYADPPWEYDDHSVDPTRQIENQYPTMVLSDIINLTDTDNKSVKDLAAKDCILYLWTTSPKVNEAMQVMSAWGFEYKTCMVWVKDIQGMGYWARQRHELLLIGTRGAPMTPAEDKRPDSVIEAPRSSVHSRKPDIVYEMLDAMYPPKIPRIELFARQARLGWHFWGLDAPAPAEAPEAGQLQMPEPEPEPAKAKPAKEDASHHNRPRLVKKRQPAAAAAAVS